MSHISFSKQAHIAHITLNNPSIHNALNQADIDELMNHLETINHDSEIRCLILTGAGEKTFCSGASFEQIKAQTLSGDFFSFMAEAIVNLRVPSICLVNGNVYGGGVELALACDFRIGIANTRLQVPIAKLGLSYSYYGLKLYHSVLGDTLTRRILLLTESIDSASLLQQGFYQYLCNDLEEAKQKATDIAQQITQLAPLSVQAMHQTLNDLKLMNTNEVNALKREKMCIESKDKTEGFKAILEKRQAQFIGE